MEIPASAYILGLKHIMSFHSRDRESENGTMRDRRRFGLVAVHLFGFEKYYYID
jgi:hypothetical protein